MAGQAQLRGRRPHGEQAVWWGAVLIAAGGAAIFLDGLVFLVVNFTGLIETGLTSRMVGTTAGALQVQNPALYNYISHLQVTLAAFAMADGILLAAVAWFGIRRGERWAVGAALVSFAVGFAFAMPMHYVYGLATLAHVGPIYVVTAAVLVGSWLAYRGMSPAPER